MSKKKRIVLVLLAAVFGFSCAPVFSPGAAPTLDPSSLNTAIALTSGAASAQTAAVSQPTRQMLAAEGPTLDPNSFGTSVAQTFEAASTQTAALIPNTLTPSVTPRATETASTTPTASATFILIIPTNTTTPFKVTVPKPTSTKKGKGKGGDDGGGGGGGGGGGTNKTFSCAVAGVVPTNYTKVSPGQLFSVYWTVKNTGSTWDADSVDLVPVKSNLIILAEGYDLPFAVSGGQTVTLPGVALMAPSTPGNYGTQWHLRRGQNEFCDMYLLVVVE